jgi:hypothetical protein
MLIGTLRNSYGASFAKSFADNEKLSDVLAKDPSLRQVIRDHEARKFGAAHGLPRPGPRISVGELSTAGDARYRDKNGEISRKHGDTLIRALRSSYGSGFAKGRADDERLSDVLAKLDGPSLLKLVSDHKAGMLSIRLRNFLGGRWSEKDDSGLCGLQTRHIADAPLRKRRVAADLRPKAPATHI